MNPTFESFLEPAGIIVAAGIITAVVQLVKTVFPSLDARISGALMAFVLSLILYVFTGVATGIGDFNTGLVLFCAWLTCATSAVGVYATIVHVNAARTS